MPRYFFDITDGGPRRDDTGFECENDADVRKAAICALPAVAKEEIPLNGDRRFFTVVVRDEADHAVYTATISFAGIWLRERPLSPNRTFRAAHPLKLCLPLQPDAPASRSAAASPSS